MNSRKGATINLLINHIPDAQVCAAPRLPPSLSKHGKVCHAAKTPWKSWVRRFPGDSAGCAGTGEQQVTLSLGQRGRQEARCSRLARSDGLPLHFPAKSHPWWSRRGSTGRGSAGADSTAPGLQLCQDHLTCCQSAGAENAAGVGAGKPHRVSSPGHSGCVGQPQHGGDLLVS